MQPVHVVLRDVPLFFGEKFRISFSFDLSLPSFRIIHHSRVWETQYVPLTRGKFSWLRRNNVIVDTRANVSATFPRLMPNTVWVIHSLYCERIHGTTTNLSAFRPVGLIHHVLSFSFSLSSLTFFSLSLLVEPLFRTSAPVVFRKPGRSWTLRISGEIFQAIRFWCFVR